MNSMSGARMKRDIVPKGYKKGRIAQFDSRQNALYQNMFQHVGQDSYLNRLAGGDEQLFNEMETPALRQFGALQGNIASRFSGQGMGARRSSGFQNELYDRSSDFAQQLQANRQNLQRQALTDLRGMSGELLNQRPYENVLAPKPQKESKPALGGWGGALGALGGGALGFFAGGPGGAATGASLGYKAFSGL